MKTTTFAKLFAVGMVLTTCAFFKATAAEPSYPQQIKNCLVFTTPIVWVGESEPPEAESLELWQMIGEFKINGLQAGMANLERFVANHPASPWTPALENHLAGHFLQNGRYSKAVGYWENAWNHTKDAPDAVSRSVASSALAGWTRLLASLGRKDQLDELFAESKRLGFDRGDHAAILQATQEGLGNMKTRPGDSYRCGSYALSEIMKLLQPDNTSWKQVRAVQSPDGGFCMSDLIEMALTNGFGLVAVERTSGDEIIVPSVVHWKLNHFAAILQKTASGFLVVDPTFGGKKILQADAINAETSGHFIIAKNNLPAGWNLLSSEQAKLVYGKGFPNLLNDDEDNSGDDDDDCPSPSPSPGDGPGGGGGDSCPPASDDPDESGDGFAPDHMSNSSDDPNGTWSVPTSGDGKDGSGPTGFDGAQTTGFGMPTWRVSEPYITLWIQDAPLFYQSSDGHPVALKLKYKHRGSSRGPNLAGFGDKWECSWLGFLEVPSGTPVSITNHLAGGGHSPFPLSGNPDYDSGRSVSYDDLIGTALIRSGYKRQNQYGAALTYLDGTKRVILTNRLDQWGRSFQLRYVSTNISGTTIMRITEAIDHDGKSCTFAYTNATYPNLITRVTDPYGRYADFIYNAQGLLTNITDMAQMSSSFKYDSSGSITNMHTPYGDTGFTYFSGTNQLCALNRALEITEPNGLKQLYAYHDAVTNAAAGTYDNSSGYPYYRSSYHWNRQQYALLSNYAKTNVLDMLNADYWKASIKHWYHGDAIDSNYSVSGTLDAMAGPAIDGSGNRANSRAFTYVGQTLGSAYIGTVKKVASIRVNSVTTLAITYNDAYRPEKFVYFPDSHAATFTNAFSDGGILLRVWGPRGERVRGYGYDATYTNLLTSVTNALGEVIRYTYDGNFHVTSVTYPSGLVTTNFYYTSGTYAGFLEKSVDIGLRTNSFTYINGNRQTHTNELGMAKTFVYDSLNRPISTSYPDGTTVSNIFDKLDLIGKKDRLNNWTRFVYNSVRQVTATTNANNQITLYDYCNCGSPSQISRFNGGTPFAVQMNYDLAGRMTNVIYPDGYQLNYAFDNNGLTKTVSDNGGHQLQYNFAPAGKTFKLSDIRTGIVYPTVVNSFAYDEYGRMISSQDRNSVTTTNDFDLLGRIVARRSFGGTEANGLESFVYRPNGLTNYFDALGRMTSFVRDVAGRVLFETNANAEVLRFTYNAADELLTLTDGKNQKTTWNYDEFGRVTNKVDDLGTNLFVYKYDPLNRLTNRWSAAKSNTVYRYDAIGNLTNVVYLQTAVIASTTNIVLQYDGLNRLTNMLDGLGTTVFNWTDGNQLASEDGPWASDTVSYDYDHRLRIAMAIKQPNASDWTQNYEHDEYWRLSSVTSPAGNFAYTYDYLGGASDRVLQTQLPSVKTTTIVSTHDSMARLTETTTYFAPNWYTSLVLNQHHYEYDSGSQRTQQVFTAGNYVNYKYDSIGQLKSARGFEPDDSLRLQEQFGYAYDQAWNLQRRTNNAFVQTFSVNTLNELTTVTNTGTYTVAGLATENKGGYNYWGSPPGVSNVVVSGTGLSSGEPELYLDGTWARTNATLANGNNSYTATAKDTYGRTDTTSVSVNLLATNTFVYDLNGNLRTNNTRVFDYDSENQLIRITEPSAWKSEFYYDGLMRRKIRREYAWQSSAWVLTHEVRYIYDGMLATQERDGNNLPQVTYTRGNDLSATLEGAGGIGGLLARTDNGQLLAGNPDAHAYYHCDGNGNVTALINTNGAIVAKYEFDPYGNTIAMSGPLAEANAYRFSSKESHGSSGLYYYGYRFYSPDLQRWVNTDPIQEYGGINVFGFVQNSPICTIDPHGEDFKQTCQNLLAAAVLAWNTLKGGDSAERIPQPPPPAAQKQKQQEVDNKAKSPKPPQPKSDPPKPQPPQPKPVLPNPTQPIVPPRVPWWQNIPIPIFMFPWQDPNWGRDQMTGLQCPA